MAFEKKFVESESLAFKAAFKLIEERGISDSHFLSGSKLKDEHENRRGFKERTFSFPLVPKRGESSLGSYGYHYAHVTMEHRKNCGHISCQCPESWIVTLEYLSE